MGIPGPAESPPPPPPPCCDHMTVRALLLQFLCSCNCGQRASFEGPRRAGSDCVDFARGRPCLKKQKKTVHRGVVCCIVLFSWGGYRLYDGLALPDLDVLRWTEDLCL